MNDIIYDSKLSTSEIDMVFLYNQLKAKERKYIEKKSKSLFKKIVAFLIKLWG